MKKIFLSFLATVASIGLMQARELTFYIGDTEIKNGETVVFSDISLVDAGGYYELKMAPDLSIGTDIFTANLSLTATCTSGQEIEMCAGGACKMGTVVEKTKLTLRPNTNLKLDFEYKAELEYDEEVPVVTAVIEAQDGNYTDTYKSFTIVMDKTAAVIDAVSGNIVTLTSAGIEYSLDTPELFTLYNIDGVAVYSANLDGNGVINTDAFSAGVYIYTIGDKSNKIYIK